MRVQLRLSGVFTHAAFTDNNPTAIRQQRHQIANTGFRTLARSSRGMHVSTKLQRRRKSRSFIVTDVAVAACLYCGEICDEIRMVLCGHLVGSACVDDAGERIQLSLRLRTDQRECCVWNSGPD
ncbi:hypothetical protein PQR63_01270 [Herbaspirillum rhizosphaerae]|uniref:Uncharacterized protein n=1 Tax=Herbaspirillum rhizosphaerae TaxID=346179 RepID=A0ABW8Z3D8_9BURK